MTKKINDIMLMFLILLSSFASFILLYFAIIVYASNFTFFSIIITANAVSFFVFFLSSFLLFFRNKEDLANASDKIRKNAVILFSELSLIIFIGVTFLVLASPLMNEIHYLNNNNYLYYFFTALCFVIVYFLPIVLLLTLYRKKANNG
jgi:hypothetical protein